MKGQEEADNERQIAALRKSSQVWINKAEKRQQLLQDGLHLQSGVTFRESHKAHKWGVCKSVSGKMTAAAFPSHVVVPLKDCEQQDDDSSRGILVGAAGIQSCNQCCHI